MSPGTSSATPTTGRDLSGPRRDPERPRAQAHLRSSGVHLGDAGDADAGRKRREALLDHKRRVARDHGVRGVVDGFDLRLEVVGEQRDAGLGCEPARGRGEAAEGEEQPWHSAGGGDAGQLLQDRGADRGDLGLDLCDRRRRDHVDAPSASSGVRRASAKPCSCIQVQAASASRGLRISLGAGCRLAATWPCRRAPAEVTSPTRRYACASQRGRR
jgi:hypothetical protein